MHTDPHVSLRSTFSNCNVLHHTASMECSTLHWS